LFCERPGDGRAAALAIVVRAGGADHHEAHARTRQRVEQTVERIHLSDARDFGEVPIERPGGSGDPGLVGAGLVLRQRLDARDRSQIRVVLRDRACDGFRAMAPFRIRDDLKPLTSVSPAHDDSG